MATKKENLKRLLTNTRSRIIILLTTFILLAAIITSLFRLHSTTTISAAANINTSAAGIESIPGSEHPTAQYAELQNSQNITNANEALKTGSSSIPTIVSSHSFGDGIEQVGASKGDGSVGFDTLAREQESGSPKSLWQQTLQRSDCSTSSINKVMSQGATLGVIRGVCSCAQMRGAGISIKLLQGHCSCKQLKAAGVNVMQLKKDGYDAAQLRTCGYSACELKNAGFSVNQLKDGGYTDGELRGAGFSPSQIYNASGLPTGVTAADVREAGCSVDSLKRLRAEGVTASSIRQISGCSATELKDAGYSVADLRKAGFSAAELKKAGFDSAALKDGGFSPISLREAGFTPNQLEDAGYSSSQVDSSGLSLPPGITPSDIADANCQPDALEHLRQAGVSAAAIKKYGNCSAAQLVAAGYSAADLKSAGYTPDQIDAATGALKLPAGVTGADVEAAGCSADALRKLRLEGVSAKAIKQLNGCSAKQLKGAGYSALALKNADFTNQQLKDAGFSPSQIQAADNGYSLPDGVSIDDIKKAGCNTDALKALRLKGVSANAIHKINGCSAEQLKAAGYSALALKKAGFTNAQLKEAGFTPDQIKAANMGINLPKGVSISDVKNAGCDVDALKLLREKGVSAKAIVKLNHCSAKQLKAAGYTAAELKAAGFSDKELKDAGFTPQQIADASLPAGVTKADIMASGCDAKKLSALREKGVSASIIHELNGCTASQLKAAGYDALAIHDAGFTNPQLKAAGFSSSEIKAADMGFSLPKGVTIDDIKKAGCNADALKKLREKGVSANAIEKINHCSASQLKAAGYSAYDLKNAGFSDAQLRAAGYSPKQIKDANEGIQLPAGVTEAEVKAAGCDPVALKKLHEKGVSANAIEKLNHCSAKQLNEAGYNALQLHNAGFSNAQLKSAGFTPSQIKAADLGFSLPDGITTSDIYNAGCNVNALKKLRSEGVSAKAIKNLNGCSAKTLKDAGYSAYDLKHAGFSDAQLVDAGFTPTQISDANNPLSLPAGITENGIEAAGCSPEALRKLRKQGVSAAVIKEVNGCSASALKAAGYTAKQLHDTGYSNAALKAAGFSKDQIQAADDGVTLPDGVSVHDVKKAGCDPQKLKKLRLKGVSAKAIIKLNHCSAKAFKDAGYTAAELKQAGMSDSQLRAAGFSPSEIDKANMTLPPGVKMDDIKKAGCNVQSLKYLRQEGVSAELIEKVNGCSASKLKAAGYDAAALKEAGFSNQQLGNAGFTPEQILGADENLPLGVTVADVRAAGCSPSALKKLREKGVTARAIRKISGCSAAELKAGGYSALDLKKAGFSNNDLKNAGFTANQIKDADLGLPPGVTQADVKNAGCNVSKLKALREKGVTAAAIEKLNHCSAQQLKAAGYSAADLLKAGFSPSELARAGYSPSQIKAGIMTPAQALAYLRKHGCTVDAIKEAKLAGLTAEQIRKAEGCSASQMKAAGFSALQLKNAGYTVAELKDAGFTSGQLEDAGFTAKQLKQAGYSAKQLADAGFSKQDLENAGFSKQALAQAGFKEKPATESTSSTNSENSDLLGLGNVTKNKKPEPNQTTLPANQGPTDVLAGIQSAASGNQGKAVSAIQKNNQKLNQILKEQQARLSSQRYQQKIQQAASAMSGAASKAISVWSQAPSQAFTYIGVHKNGGDGANQGRGQGGNANQNSKSQQPRDALVKAGDIMYAVLDTSVNSDEPGPVLATIVSGKFRNGKLIGSFSLPPNGEKLILTFNRLALKSARNTISISAVAIDPDTARTALASRTDNHYLLRYGSLFASSFLTGFGNAFQSAGTTITIGGTTSNVAVTQGIGRSVLENAVIGLAQVGKEWGTQAQQYFNTPPTVELFSGTGMGILFTQDINSID